FFHQGNMQGHDPCHYRDPEVFCNGSQTVLLILASEMVTKDLVSFLAIYFSYFPEWTDTISKSASIPLLSN
ncbi:MAG: hypothetical protein VX541_06465, partial [Candidatus Poribacteria bacterium]|nr:hypothetical protein [Candidatus Poribacteria bacterium]